MRFKMTDGSDRLLLQKIILRSAIDAQRRATRRIPSLLPNLSANA